nr:MAG TPA: hypothetical protein [Caudoviricetes sp.]
MNFLGEVHGLDEKGYIQLLCQLYSFKSPLFHILIKL